MWACGIIMYELMIGKHPFYREGMEKEQIFELIMSLKKRGNAQMLTESLDIPEKPKDLLNQLLNERKS
jgi:serine/threonine protein kinase